MAFQSTPKHTISAKERKAIKLTWNVMFFPPTAVVSRPHSVSPDLENRFGCWLSGTGQTYEEGQTSESTSLFL